MFDEAPKGSLNGPHRSADRTTSPAGSAPSASVARPDRPSADAPEIDRRAVRLARTAVRGAFGAVTFLTFPGQIEPGRVLRPAFLELGVRPVLGMAASPRPMLGRRRWLEGRGGAGPPGWIAAAVAACTPFGVARAPGTHVGFNPFVSEPAPIDRARFPSVVLEDSVVLLASIAGYLWLRSRRDVPRKEATHA